MAEDKAEIMWELLEYKVEDVVGMAELLRKHVNSRDATHAVVCLVELEGKVKSLGVMMRNFLPEMCKVVEEVMSDG